MNPPHSGPRACALPGPRSLDARIARFALAALVAWATLAGCASAPPLQLLHLRAATPTSAAASTMANTLVWQLALPVRLPDYLDRDALVVPLGPAGLQAVPGYRWAEPLRESVPRLLRQDLATLLGESRVWTAPLPPGLVVQRQLRLELLGLESNSDRSAVVLRARWSLIDPTGAIAPRIESTVLTVPTAGGDVDHLVVAHRLALWRLAERVAGTEAAR